MTRTAVSTGNYDYHLPNEGGHHHAYLRPVVLSLLPPPCRLFEIGCGNGLLSNELQVRGYSVTGVDPSETGIAIARAAYPTLDLRVGSVYDDLSEHHGKFPALLCLEVVEHLYAPRLLAKAAFDILCPGGTLVLSTPYHGYWKNLALAITGRMEQHLAPLWDHGHIKFWSEKSLTALLLEAGFADLQFKRIGRISALAKSVVVRATKPGA